MGFKRIMLSFFWLIGVAAMLILILVFLRGRGAEEIAPELTPVRAGYPVRGVMEETLHYPGTLMPEKTIAVISKVSGKVEHISIDEGSYVYQDDILASIDSRVVKLQMDQAYAAYQAADAQYRQAVEGVRDEELRNTEALVAQAVKDVELARTNLDRVKRLYENGAATRQEYEGAENRIQNAEVQLENAQRSLSMMRKGATDTELDMARSNMAAMEAQYELARIQYENATIVAPVSGVIVDVMVDQGGMVGTGTPVAAIVVDDPIYVEIQMPEQYYSRIKPRIGEIEVRVSPIAYPDHEYFPGKVTSLSPVIDPYSRTFTIEAAVDNPGKELLPGMYVNVEIVVRSLPDTTLLPSRAVVQRDGREMVFLVSEGNSYHVEMRPVTTGLRNAGMTEIKEGIDMGDWVVLEGNAFLEEGQMVRVLGKE